MKTIILCGGSGTRLWPISRKSTPKQFARIFAGQSLFEQTIKRNNSISDGFTIIVNEAQLAQCESQAYDSTNKDKTFLIEPVGRNTAPAIALSALACDPEEILLILPSDHLIKNEQKYKNCIDKAVKLAQNNNLVTFGIKAQYPETGFGYIEHDNENVLSFKEKPTLEVATSYLEKGNFLWNSGMFCFKAKVFLNELKEYSPEIYNQACITFNNKQRNESIHRFQKEDMQKIPSDSIDYAVMEKSNNVKVVPSDFHWSDLGSFDALYEELDQDKDGNTKEDFYCQENSKNNLIVTDKKLIATFDIEDLIIVETKDALLVGKRGQSQKVKELLKKVKEKAPDLLD